MTFKTGDVVVCVDAENVPSTNKLTLNKEYVVIEEDCERVTVTADNGKAEFFYPSRFVLKSAIPVVTANDLKGEFDDIEITISELTNRRIQIIESLRKMGLALINDKSLSNNWTGRRVVCDNRGNTSLKVGVVYYVKDHDLQANAIFINNDCDEDAWYPTGWFVVLKND